MRKPEALADLVAEHPDNTLLLKLDVTTAVDIEQAVAEAETRLGQIDMLVNNTGYGYLAAREVSGRPFETARLGARR